VVKSAAPFDELPKGYVVRFNVRERLEHLLVMILFTVLLVTGLPQKFHDSAWGHWLIVHLGGIGRLRFVHRFCGVLFTLLFVSHVTTIIYLLRKRRIRPTMIPNLKDYYDAVLMLKFYLGWTDQRPSFGRFDYREKFEYWGLLMGSLVMILTGWMLYQPMWVARWLPGELIPAAKVAHGMEALLALIVLVLWHMYCAHLNPEVFPFDTTIFTGKISIDRMVRDHPLEYARLLEARVAEPPAPEPVEVGAEEVSAGARGGDAGTDDEEAQAAPEAKQDG